MPVTSKENGRVAPGIASGGPMLTPALKIPVGNCPPKILTPGLVKTPVEVN